MSRLWMMNLHYLYIKIILLSRITSDSKTNLGSGLEKIFASIPKNSFSCTTDMTKNKVFSSSIGEILIWRTPNLEELGTPMMSNQSAGNMQLEGKLYLIISRGVPIIYYKSIISVIFNRNFEILNVKSIY